MLLSPIIRLCGLVGTCFALVLAGCSSEEALLPVSGVISEAKKSLAGGTVTLRPDLEKGNKSHHHPTGIIDKQGRYTLFTVEQEGAPAGWYKVVVFSNEPVEIQGKAHPGMPKSLINTRYNQPQSTPLAVEVKHDAPPGAYDFDLQK